MSSLRGVVWASVWTAWAAFSSPCSARAVAPRSDNGVAALSVLPSQSWDGIDGQWNSFFLHIGEPAQYVRVLVSTNSQQIWAVDPHDCMTNPVWINANNTQGCENSRGGVFNTTASSSWKDQGWYSLYIEENLGYTGSATTGHYGYETVALGDAGRPIVKNVTMATETYVNFWMGHIGLHPKPTNFSTFGEQSPSFMTLLKEQGSIPSLSYGYTGGATYRFTKVLSSLTLGGYDMSRFIPNDVSFNFAPDNDRDLVVWIQSVTMTNGTQNATLLSDPINIFIDSSVAELWLPIPVCKQFEAAFGLVYDGEHNLYLVNDTLHKTLLSQNANVTFTIGSEKTNGPTVNIVLPYAAFDQIASYPYQNLGSSSNYFPLRQALNDSQYTLGRVFLQEAYIIVDHERGNFSVSQVAWLNNPPAQIVTIAPVDQPHSGGLGKAAIAGIAVGASAVIVAAAITAFLWRRHVKKKEKEAAQAKLAAEVLAAKDTLSEKSRESESQQRPASSEQTDPTTFVFPKAELPANEMPRHEMSTDSDAGSVDKSADGDVQSPTSTAVGTLDTTGTGTLVNPEPVEAENSERPIYEMEGDMPAPTEADSRMLSEKESMIVRERRYNGTDPDPIPSPNTPTDHSDTAGPSPTSTISSEPRLRPPPRHRPPLTAADVAMVPRSGTQLSIISRPSVRGWDGGATGTMPISPLSPRAPVSLEETILSPLSPLTASEGSDGSRTLASSNPDRRRFSYELDDSEEGTR